MAVIYLKHPRHGEKVACSDMEAKEDKLRGWVEFDPRANPPPAPAPAVVVEAEEATDTVPEPDAQTNTMAQPQQGRRRRSN